MRLLPPVANLAPPRWFVEQGRIQEVKPSYAAFVTDAYVKKAMGK